MALERLIIRQCANADWAHPFCRPPVIREWLYDGELLLVSQGESVTVNEPQNDPGLFYRVGEVYFHIADNRRRLVLVYILGPRYAKGLILEVRGQGKAGKLVPADSPGWIS